MGFIGWAGSTGGPAAGGVCGTAEALVCFWVGADGRCQFCEVDGAQGSSCCGRGQRRRGGVEERRSGREQLSEKEERSGTERRIMGSKKKQKRIKKKN